MSANILVLTAIDNELSKARAPDGARGDLYRRRQGQCGERRDAGAACVATAACHQLRHRRKDSRHIHNGLVEVADVIQRDMAAMPLAPRGRTPFSPELDRLSSGFGTVVCGTGDSFVTAIDPWLVNNNIDIVDMELFAIAHVCHRHGVPWRAFKFITDAADDNAADHWNENVANGEDLFWDVMKTLNV